MDSTKHLIDLRDKLKLFNDYKNSHRIEFQDWDKYPEQTDIINRVVNRVKTGKGQKIFVIFGGNQCLGPDQIIYDPVDRSYDKVSELKGYSSVNTWDKQNKTESLACKPFIKSKDHVYRFKFKNGQTLDASLNHRILTPFDYKPMSQLLDGEQVFLHHSNWVSYLKAQILNVWRYKKKAVSYQSCYQAYHRSNDGQPLRYSTCDPSNVPLLAYAQKRNGCASETSDDPSDKPKHNRLYLLFSRLSSLDVVHRFLVRFFASLFHALCIALKPVLSLCKLIYQLLYVSSFVSLLTRSLNQMGRYILSFCSCDITSTTIVTDIEYLGKKDIWDFEVPVTNNYFIGGIVNHNSGKTEASAAVATRIAEEIPDSRLLCATIESRISINVQQRKIRDWLTPDKIHTGEYNQSRGWKNSIIEGTNGYAILFKTYAQGYEPFQGDEFNIVLLDEEPPWDIFQECLMRTVKRNGAILFTFTSLQGYTRLVNRLWESNDPEVWTTLLDLYMNPYIDKESKDMIANTIDPDEVDSRIHGKPHLKEGLIYKEFGDIHKVDRFDYASLVGSNPNRWHIHCGIDPHTRTPHHWLRFLFDRANNVLYVVEALKAPKESMLVDDFARMIKAKQVKYKGTILHPRYTQIDTSSMTPEVTHTQGDEEQEDIHTVRLSFFKAGIQTILCTKDNSVGINAVKTRLKVVRKPDGTIKRNPRIYVFKDLTDVSWEFMRYSWGSFANSKISEKKEMINSPQKKDDHYMDVIKYECIKIQLDNGEDKVYPEYVPRYPDMNY